MPNFIEIGPVVWISIADTHGTHTDFYILDICSDRMKDNPSFELKTSLNHMSESKCRRGLNLDPMVQVTDKPCRLMMFQTLEYFLGHL